MFRTALAEDRFWRMYPFVCWAVSMLVLSEPTEKGNQPFWIYWRESWFRRKGVLPGAAESHEAIWISIRFWRRESRFVRYCRMHFPICLSWKRKCCRNMKRWEIAVRSVWMGFCRMLGKFRTYWSTAVSIWLMPEYRRSHRDLDYWISVWKRMLPCWVEGSAPRCCYASCCWKIRWFWFWMSRPTIWMRDILHGWRTFWFPMSMHLFWCRMIFRF